MERSSTCGFPVSSSLAGYLRSTARARPIHKYQYLLHEGEVSRKAWWLEKGLVRCFYTRGDQDVIVWFAREGQVVMETESLFSRETSRYYIQALENGTAWQLEYHQVEYIMEHFPEAQLLKERIGSWYLHLLQMRLRATSRQTPQEKYNYLLRHFSYLHGRVSLDMIAAYLDMNRRTLTRLRAR